MITKAPDMIMDKCVEAIEKFPVPIPIIKKSIESYEEKNYIECILIWRVPFKFDK